MGIGKNRSGEKTGLRWGPERPRRLFSKISGDPPKNLRGILVQLGEKCARVRGGALHLLSTREAVSGLIKRNFLRKFEFEENRGGLGGFCYWLFQTGFV